VAELFGDRLALGRVQLGAGLQRLGVVGIGEMLDLLQIGLQVGRPPAGDFVVVPGGGGIGGQVTI